MPLITHPLVRAASGHRAARRCTRCRAARSASSACRTTRRSTCSTSSPRTRRSRNIVISFKYGVGDVVIWDNASLLHSATLTDPDDPRTLWRITIKEPSAKLDALDVLAPTFASGAM